MTIMETERIKEIICRMKTIKVSSEDLAEKELEDLFREMKDKGEWSSEEIKFSSDEKKEYFEKLTKRLGINGDELLSRLLHSS